MWISDAFPILSHSFDGSNWILSFPHALCVAKRYAGSRQVKGKANPIPIFQPVPREAGGQVQVERGMNPWPMMNQWSLDHFGSTMNPGFRETTLTSYLTCSIGDLDVFPWALGYLMSWSLGSWCLWCDHGSEDSISLVRSGLSQLGMACRSKSGLIGTALQGGYIGYISHWWFGTMEFYDFPYLGNFMIPIDFYILGTFGLFFHILGISWSQLTFISWEHLDYFSISGEFHDPNWLLYLGNIWIIFPYLGNFMIPID